LFDLGVELLDLQLVGRLAIPTSARVERPKRLILKLLLQGDLCLQHRIDSPSCLLHYPLRLSKRNGIRTT
jgi:hypothetical protein